METSEHTIHSVHLRDLDPDQLLEVVQGARFEHFILSQAKCDAHLTRWSYGSFVVDIGRYNFAVRAVGPFPKDKLCLGYIRNFNDATWVNGFHVTRETMELYPQGTELNYRATPGGEWVAIEFEEEALQNAARARLGHELDLPWKHVISFIPSDHRAAIDWMVRRLWSQPHPPGTMVEAILGAIAEMLWSLRYQTGETPSLNWRNRQAVLHRADRFIRANLNYPFSLSDLAIATGTTPRTLQREFVNAYGMGPKKWVRCFALNHVRRRLLFDDIRKFTVEGLAYESGFRHMGRFAAYYSQLFGETPSRTLSRRQGREAGDDAYASSRNSLL